MQKKIILTLAFITIMLLSARCLAKEIVVSLEIGPEDWETTVYYSPPKPFDPDWEKTTFQGIVKFTKDNTIADIYPGDRIRVNIAISSLVIKSNILPYLSLSIGGEIPGGSSAIGIDPTFDNDGTLVVSLSNFGLWGQASSGIIHGFWFNMTANSPKQGDYLTSLSASFVVPDKFETGFPINPGQSLKVDHFYFIVDLEGDHRELEFPILVKSTTYTVDDDGPADFNTIHDAINAAHSGDMIFVYPGVYKEHVEMKDEVNLFGSGPHVCTIDANSSWGETVKFEGSALTIISGFKITGANIGITYSGPLIVRNNIITGNQVGISLGFGNQPIISNIINNTIASNGNSGIKIFNAPEAQVIKNNIIVSNGTYGIYCSNSSTGNISFNDVWNNSTNYYNAVALSPFTPVPGTGEISQNPAFEDADFHLAEDSPCKDTGAPGPEFNDPDGTRNDMGAFGGPGAEGGKGSFGGSGFIFTSIGKIPTSEITQTANPSQGLANVSDKVANDFRIHKFTDSPFGGNLWVHGLFGINDDVDYYQILIGKWNNNTMPDPNAFINLKDPLTKVKYIINPDGSVSHQYVSLGPKTINGTKDLYQLTRDGYWTHIDLRIIWNTRLWENGKYTLACKAYRSNPGTGVLEQVTLSSNDLEKLILIIDNSPVQCVIHSVKYDNSNPNYDPNDDGEIPECAIINLTSTVENLRFNITAYHPNEYLRAYILDTPYGKDQNGGVIKSEYYVVTSPPLWPGVQNKEFQSQNGALQPWKPCAYQFRLRTYSRTTNGYHYIIWKEFNDHYYIDLGDHNLCKGDFDNDGDVDAADLVDFASEFGRTDCLP